MAVDALGNPIRFLLTPGQHADCSHAIKLVDGMELKKLLADKGYDTDAIVEHVKSQGGEPVIPPKANRKEQRNCDYSLYKERHKVECTFGFLKHYRRVFSRFDKFARNFIAFIHIAAALVWCR